MPNHQNVELSRRLTSDIQYYEIMSFDIFAKKRSNILNTVDLNHKVPVIVKAV